MNNNFNLAKQGDAYNEMYSSPVFLFSNTAEIATTQTVLFSYNDLNRACQKYSYFNNHSITNNSSQPIMFYPNQDRTRGIFIANNETKVIGSEAVAGTTSALFENLGSGTIAVGELRLNIWKQTATLQDTFARVHRKFFGEVSIPQLPSNIKRILGYGV